MLQFKLKHLVAVITFVALYFGLIAGTARLFGVNSQSMFSVWTIEFVRWPLYVLWTVAAVTIFERRSANPVSATLALAALVGFVGLSLLNMFFRIWFMGAIQMGAPAASASAFMTVWTIVQGLLSTVCWILLMIALVKAMKRSSNTLDESHAFGTQSV